MGDKLREALQKFSNDLDAMRSTMSRQALEAMDFFRRSLDDILVLAEPQPAPPSLSVTFKDWFQESEWFGKTATLELVRCAQAAWAAALLGAAKPADIRAPEEAAQLCEAQVEAILCGDVYDINDDPDTPKLTAAINAALKSQVSVTGQSEGHKK